MNETESAPSLFRRELLAIGLALSVTACQEALEPNRPPVVDAGPDIVVDESSTAVLSGGASDPDGEVVRVAWAQEEGTPVSLTSADRSTARFETPVTTEVLVLRFSLTAQDDQGATGRDEVTVTVRPVNAPPVVSAGLAQEADEQTVVRLSGSVSDDDGEIVAITWTQTGGEAVTLEGADRDTATFRAPVTTVPLTLSFELRATDNENAWAADSVTVRIRPVNAPPRVEAGDDQVVPEATVVSLVGSASDPDGEITEVGWRQVEGPAVTLVGADSARATFTAPVTTTPVTLSFELRAVDNEGGSAADTMTVVVEPVNALPVVSAGQDRVVPEGSLVSLVGAASDDDGEIVQLSWTQLQGVSVSLSGADQETATFTAPVTTAPLILRFELQATDNEGASASDTVSVRVEPVNEPPSVTAGQDQMVVEESTVHLIGSASDQDGSVESVSWRQTGGPPVELNRAETLDADFLAPATVLPRTLSFRLTVVDNEGASASDDVTVEVWARIDAGFHYSLYSSAGEQPPEHWIDFAETMAGQFWQGAPGGLWTVAHVFGRRPLLTFPGTSSDPYIDFSAQDETEAVLSRFDEAGVGVWLLIEAGDASVEELIRLVLDRYGHHPSVRGVGVDIEWFRSFSYSDGKAVTDTEARSWRDRVRSFDAEDRLMLIHWEQSKMPPNLREGLVFLDDSQGFRSLNAMLNEFAAWGAHFTPARTAFLYGFDSDRTWWSTISDPAVEIGRRILGRVPNAVGLFWIQ